MNTQTSESIIRDAYATNDQEHYWQLIAKLHKRGTLIEFNLAVKLCNSEDPTNREIGADILGQLGWKNKAFQQESVLILIKLLSDSAEDVISSAAYALGHRNTYEAIKPLLAHEHHPNPRVRHSVVFGLLGLEDNEAIDSLINLSEDEDDNVRNWATFGLGSQIEANTPEVRSALEKRLNDPVSEIRGEALVGLAARGRNSIKEQLIRELAKSDTGTLALEAATLIGSNDLCKPLQDIENTLEDDDNDYFISQLFDALNSCCRNTNNRT